MPELRPVVDYDFHNSLGLDQKYLRIVIKARTLSSTIMGS